jgi:cytidylate kinase
MHIIKISAPAGAGKSEALNALADHFGGKVIHSSDLMSAMGILMSQASALSPNTFVDEVTPNMLPKIEKLAKLYPNTYHMYVVVEGK